MIKALQLYFIWSYKRSEDVSIEFHEMRQCSICTSEASRFHHGWIVLCIFIHFSFLRTPQEKFKFKKVSGNPRTEKEIIILKAIGLTKLESHKNTKRFGKIHTISTVKTKD